MQHHIRQFVLLDVGVFDITDRVGQTGYESGHALITLAACANGPIHRAVLADFGLPFGIHLAKVAGKQKCGAGAVSTAHRCDRCVRQIYGRVDGLDSRIVPARNLAQINVAENLAAELQLARLYPLDIDDGYHAQNHRGKLDLALGLQNVVGLRGV